MSSREPMSKVQDKKVFSHTAERTKRINVAPSIMRGGIRL